VEGGQSKGTDAFLQYYRGGERAVTRLGRAYGGVKEGRTSDSSGGVHKEIERRISLETGIPSGIREGALKGGGVVDREFRGIGIPRWKRV